MLFYYCLRYSWGDDDTFAGIGRPPGKMDPANFVLRPFTKKEQEEVCSAE
jgi:hypothetical protein